MTRPRAPYACDPAKSRGRLYPEEADPSRTAFQRDRDRIIHSGAFRRLQYKTQVFVYHEGDHYRTRLTHSLEVAQIGRSIARVLGLDEDLTEALALAHDLGHTPFGHAGEDALNAAMAPFGGFDHNAQALKLVTSLEKRYAEFDGLNLAWETLEGLIKHNGPLAGPRARGKKIPEAVLAYNAKHDLRLDSFASLEAQVAALSDDIAYNNHDIDDGLRAGLFSIEDLAGVPLAGDVFAEVQRKYPGRDRPRLANESVRRLISAMIGDVVCETERRVAAAGARSADDVRAAEGPLVAFSPAMAAGEKRLKEFLFGHMYRHERVKEQVARAKTIVRDLFGHFLARPAALPEEWARLCGPPDSAATAQVAADYIAGMTDRFAQVEWGRIFGSKPG